MMVDGTQVREQQEAAELAQAVAALEARLEPPACCWLQRERDLIFRRTGQKLQSDRHAVDCLRRPLGSAPIIIGRSNLETLLHAADRLMALGAVEDQDLIDDLATACDAAAQALGVELK